MLPVINKKILVSVTLCLALAGVQSFAQKEHDRDEQATNLKVLPKGTSHDELMKIMRTYSKSLGVHCNFCHEAHVVPGQQRPDMDFASDAKPEKQTAREMMVMTADLNSKYISKMTDKTLEQVTCVSCHNGSTKPIVSVDSLAKREITK